MEVKIDRLDHQGRGIAVTDKVTFIPNTLKDEVVDIDIIETKKKYNIGKVNKYIKTSDGRIKPICPYYLECGGCDLMHITYKDEVLYKEAKVKDIMHKFANIDNVSNIIPCDMEYAYRDKITLKVSDKLGLYQKNSHDIINIDSCYLVSDKVNNYIKIINSLDLKDINEVVIKEAKYGNMVIFFLKNDRDIDITQFDCNVVKSLNGKFKVLKGEDYIIDEIGDFKYKISPLSFFQVNKYQVKKLYDLVLENLDLNKEDILLDLYCGTGTIGIYVSKFAGKVLGIEINEYAIKDAEYNKKLNNIDNISFIAGDSKIINNLDYKPNKVVVDPPRAGLDKEVINYLMNAALNKIVYVSCDPVTLARDINLLKEKYDIKKIIPVDMFPKTYHVENVCVLERK